MEFRMVAADEEMPQGLLTSCKKVSQHHSHERESMSAVRISNKEGRQDAERRSVHGNKEHETARATHALQVQVVLSRVQSRGGDPEGDHAGRIRCALVRSIGNQKRHCRASSRPGESAA